MSFLKKKNKSWLDDLDSDFTKLCINWVIANIIVNTVIIVSGLGLIWIVYNHVIAPSFNIPTIQVQ